LIYAVHVQELFPFSNSILPGQSFALRGINGWASFKPLPRPDRPGVGLSRAEPGLTTKNFRAGWPSLGEHPGQVYPPLPALQRTPNPSGGALMDCLKGLPREDPSRSINAVLAWRNLDGQKYYQFDLRRSENDTLQITASRCLLEPIPDKEWEVSFERDWSPAPLLPPRLIPDPRSLRLRFGGDPITIRLEGCLKHKRMFIGGLDNQTFQRPEVSAVLNLTEEASLWTLRTNTHPQDRWAQKGEGSKGMSAGDLAAEADWVIAHLINEARVLVHCSAGMNRSSSVCCAALIRLEGLSAEAALERVREHHPWARPDPHHWLALRWLASRSMI
jgi:hypothetical protein